MVPSLAPTSTLITPLWATSFCAAMLLAVAVFPLAAEHWWEHNRNKLIVSVALSLPVLLYLLFHHGADRIPRAVEEYFAFIVLLGSLFVISGGILVEGTSGPRRGSIPAFWRWARCWPPSWAQPAPACS